MISKRLWHLLRLMRELWVRTVILAAMAVVAAALASVLSPLIPEDLAKSFGKDAALSVLNIIANSMLTVTTFSLTIMVSAYQWASSQSTPRAQRVLLEDTTTHTVLATFLGAFIFALLSIILLRAHLYGERAAVVVFGFTVGVVVMVVLAMLRWIEHLSRLGSMDDTLEQIEGRARDALEIRRDRPSLGARPMSAAHHIPAGGTKVRAGRGGYIQFIDTGAINACAETAEAEFYVTVLPGDHVTAGSALGYAIGGDADYHSKINAAIHIGDLRTPDQDPRFGLLVLSEIASRALSPGINDPGTAIDVAFRLERLLLDHARPGPTAREVRYPRVHSRVLTDAHLVRDAFGALCRDGAPLIEVAVRVQHALKELRERGAPEMAAAAEDMARSALAYGEALLPLDEEKEKLRQISGIPAEG
ncbi:DUF2254 domain-containing protein [Acidimangrovimonas sediminis]|uniref:DUF2254 domain-containing protein n=1 Tax=Acidimangrovimonas sediminis TaxID=2056283 RepID=UPI00130483F5|nr:DUF2254 domain-containing protein [Acidimangrovimonas sediminis]